MSKKNMGIKEPGSTGLQKCERMVEANTVLHPAKIEGLFLTAQDYFNLKQFELWSTIRSLSRSG